MLLYDQARDLFASKRVYFIDHFHAPHQTGHKQALYMLDVLLTILPYK
jgi:hypothetical protein